MHVLIKHMTTLFKLESPFTLSQSFLLLQPIPNTIFCQQSPYSQSYGFSSSHIQMWELDHKEGWALKNWYFWTMVLEKTLKSLLDSKEIKPVNPKWNQPWIFFGRTDEEMEASIVWPPDTKSWLIGKDLDTGKNWRQEEKGTTEDEMVGWASPTQRTWVWANSRDGEGQGSLVCCSHAVTS